MILFGPLRSRSVVSPDREGRDRGGAEADNKKHRGCEPDLRILIDAGGLRLGRIVDDLHCVSDPVIYPEALGDGSEKLDFLP